MWKRRLNSRSGRPNKRHSRAQGNLRAGSAVTECALVAPLLVLLLLGGIDVGQAVNVAQVVNDASRHGARCASRADVSDIGDVESAVEDYISKAFPGLSTGEIASAVSVNVADDAGVIGNGDLSAVESGEFVSVEVTLSYESFRWMVGFAGLNGKSMSTITVMRRE